MRFCLLAVILAGSLYFVGCGSSSSGKSSSSLASVPPNEAFLTTAIAGAAYTQTFTFTGGTPPLTVTAPLGAPDGLVFTAGTDTATLSGMPSTAQTGSFEIEVVDAKNVTQILTYALSVVNAAPGITLSPTTLPAAISQVLYDQSLTLTGGTAPFTWSVINGTLPPGLAFSSATTTANVNALTGKPTTAGTYPFTIVVMDTSSPVQTGLFPTSLTVN
jgi:hypothetical protein